MGFPRAAGAGPKRKRMASDVSEFTDAAENRDPTQETRTPLA